MISTAYMMKKSEITSDARQRDKKDSMKKQ
jgi:hypothetical protein